MKEKLQNDIELLRAELSRVDDAESFSEHFQAVKAALDQLEKNADLEEPDEINEQLNKVVTDFEIDHPIIHGLLRNVMKTLSDIGI